MLEYLHGEQVFCRWLFPKCTNTVTTPCENLTTFYFMFYVEILVGTLYFSNIFFKFFFPHRNTGNHASTKFHVKMAVA